MRIYVRFLLFFISLFTLSAHAAEIAPPWKLKTQAGEYINSTEYKGQPIILHFWATWCPYCRRLQPKLVELQKKYQAQGVKIVGVSILEDEGAKPQDEIDDRGYKFTTGIEGEAVAKLYGVKGTPTTFFINRQGVIIFKTSSSDIKDPRFELAIKEIIKK